MEIDFEKAYNEALERAKRLLDSKYQTMNAKRVVEEIFPELCESEDERIRKELIAILKASYNSGITLNNKKDLDGYLAYLEKQKENPKTADSIPSDCASDAKCEDRWHKVGDSLPDNGRLVLANDCLGNTLLARYDGEGNWEVSVYDNDDYYCRNTITKWCDIPSEKQKEQTSDIILKAFENSKTDYSLEEREEASDYSEKVLPTSIACGESDEEFLLHKVIEAAYIAGQKEQKPPIAGNDFGWIDELKHDLEHPEELDQKVDDVLKQRKGIRALEWSKEDELNCNRIIRFLEPHKTFFPMKETKEEMQNWLKNRLKSLRPSWKPSEEQMRVLKQVEDRVAMKSGYWEQVLDSLYCDLQKL